MQAIAAQQLSYFPGQEPMRHVTAYRPPAPIPYSIKRAEVELAWQAHLNPDAIIGGGGGGASQGTFVSRQKLGSLEVEYEQYQGTTVTSSDSCNDPIVITKFPFIRGLIGCWLTGVSGGVGLMLRVRS